MAGVNRKTGAVDEMHQIGKFNKNGSPVIRERNAADDVEGASGIRPTVHDYNSSQTSISGQQRSSNANSSGGSQDTPRDGLQ